MYFGKYKKSRSIFRWEPGNGKDCFNRGSSGETEDETGTPFVGRAGKLLNEFLSEAGISRQDDLYIINTVKCRPPENRVPTDVEKSLCERYLTAQIDIMNPKAIIFCGATSLKSFYQDKKVQISKVRGKWFDVTINGKTYKSMAIFHPSYLLRNHSMEDGSPRRLMQQDLLEIKSTILTDKVFNDKKFGELTMA